MLPLSHSYGLTVMNAGAILGSSSERAYTGLRGVVIALWGGMLSGSGRTYMFRAPWMAIWPGVAISLAVFSFNMLGDALREVLDPRIRGA